MIKRQKIVLGAGVIVGALRLAFPVKVGYLFGFKFRGGDIPEFMQRVDWGQTLIHLGIIAAVTATFVYILKEK